MRKRHERPRRNRTISCLSPIDVPSSILEILPEKEFQVDIDRNFCHPILDAIQKEERSKPFK